jgi:hypothetical protein
MDLNRQPQRIIVAGNRASGCGSGQRGNRRQSLCGSDVEWDNRLGHVIANKQELSRGIGGEPNCRRKACGA